MIPWSVPRASAAGPSFRWAPGCAGRCPTSRRQEAGGACLSPPEGEPAAHSESGPGGHPSPSAAWEPELHPSGLSLISTRQESLTSSLFALEETEAPKPPGDAPLGDISPDLSRVFLTQSVYPGPVDALRL